MAEKGSKHPRLSAAIEAARKNPEREGCWNEVEHLAGAVQRPEDVADLYRDVLKKNLPPDVKTAVGLRALRFYDEWFGGEDSPALVGVLSRILEASPAEEAALSRLTVVLTVGARWPELLGVYDRALAATEDDGKRVRLLEEALQVAKDFAGEPDRAIGYLQLLVPLRPGDPSLATSLERLLEAQSRWQELIDFWTERLEGESPAESRRTREAIAGCWLEHLGEPAAALAELEIVLATPGDDAEACRLLEKIVAEKTADASVRLGALALLRARYDEAGRAEDAVAILAAALAFAAPSEKAELHRELGARLAALGREQGALEHLASLLVLVPSATDAQDRMRQLAERTSSHARYAEAIVAAARATDDVARRLDLLGEAADVRAGPAGDASGAIDLYAEVLADAAAEPPLSLRVARRLDALLAAAERFPEQLDVLEKRASLEPEAVVARELHGEAARLAERLGQTARAERVWRRRVTGAPGDLEALDALAALVEKDGRWDALVEVLRERRAAPLAASARRADLVRIARLYADELDAAEPATAAWTELAGEFGEDAECVDALAGLLSRQARWAELAELLDRAAGKGTTRQADLYAQLGDAERAQLDAPELAEVAYRHALEAEPSEARARAGMLALLEVATTRAAAARALARAYETTGDHAALLGILEARVDTAGSPADKARLLVEAARLHEQPPADVAAALRALARAMPLTPEDAAIEREIERLAEATGDWKTAVAAYRAAAAAISELGATGAAGRIGHLKRREGALLERLGSHAAALAAHLDAARIDPDYAAAPAAVVRVAARAGRWDEAARAVVGSAIGRGAVDDALLREIEGVAEGAKWDAAVRAVEEAMAAREDLPSALAHTLEARVAAWHDSRRSDRAAAEAAYLRAVRHDGSRIGTLQALAGVQRSAPGRPLFDTLLAIADLRLTDLDPLREAAEVAIGPLASRDLARGVLSRLFDVAGRLWLRGEGAAGELTPMDAAVWAMDRLSDLHTSAGQHGRVVLLLAEASRLPFTEDRARELAHRAAALASQKVGDTVGAIDIYRGILDRTPGDAPAIERLAALYTTSERMVELLALRKHELGLSTDRERRLELRLEISRLAGVIEERGGRIEALRANLDERPGHDASIDALCAVLEAKGKHAGLCDVITEQAAKVEGRGEAPRAAKLWARVARLAELSLGDIDRAIASHRRVVALQATPESLDALARLHEGRAEHALAARWLERRLEGAEATERTQVALRLARAHIAAGQDGRAIGWLERTLIKHPDATELRELLASLYRAGEAWAPLAKLLAEACEHASDDESRIAYVREAAALYRDRLQTPERAIPLLEQAMRLVPDDRWVKTTLAEGLHAAGRLPEAREILEGVIGDFGRRRSAERAVVHHHLARVLRSQGKLGEALAQLDLATSMKVGDTAVMAMLGDVAREAGQLDRAEQAYRALLLVLRRQSDVTDPEAVGTSEVLYALSRIAAGQGQKQASEELTASAVKAASQSVVEARRFKRAAASGGHADLVLQALEARLSFEPAGKAGAVALSEMADVLETALERPDEALDAWLRALDAAPDEPAIHAAARKLAVRLRKIEGYLDRVTALVDARRRTEEAREVSVLLLRLGEAVEQDVGDLVRAGEIYARVEAMGELPVQANKALARLAGMRGVSAEQRRRLEEIVGLASAPPELVVDALYRLADLDLASADARERGLRALEEALEKDPQYERAAVMLAGAADGAPDDAELWTLYQRVARVAGDDGMLLEYLERRAAHPGATLGELKEAIDLAVARGERDREEALLTRTVERARELGGGLADAVWAPLALATRRKEAGDVPGAVRWLREAAAVSDPEPSRDLLVRAAELATGPDGDLRAAVEIYEQLLERDPASRTAWEPLLALHRRLAAHEKQAALVRSTLEVLPDPAQRNALRMDHARHLLESDARELRDEAQVLLSDVLVEEPEHAEATELLVGVFEETGDRLGLGELLGKQLDAAKDRRDSAAVASTSLRIAEALATGGDAGTARREEAMDVLRAALEWAPADRAVLSALVAMSTGDDDARERARAMEQLLAVESGAAGAALGAKLAELYASLGDDDGMERALAGAHRAAPEDEALRVRLRSWYEQREDWPKMAGMLAAEGEHQATPAASLACYRQAAAIYETRLFDLSSAAAALGKAFGLASSDASLAGELVRARSLAGEQRVAVAELGDAIARQAAGGRQLLPLLKLRAELRQSIGLEADAVADLEQAFAIGGTEEAERLVAGLHAWLDRASLGGDLFAERAATTRLVEVLTTTGDRDGARDVLAGWVASDPTDRDAIRSLREMDAATGNWAAVGESCERLIGLEQGEDRVDTALRLADAWERAGEPASARPGLEQAFSKDPSSDALRERLYKLYETIGAHRELAAILLAAAEQSTDPKVRFTELRRASELMVASGDGAEALGPLRAAILIRPDDMDVQVLLIDALIAGGLHEEAQKRLDAGIAAQGRRRTPELAVLQHRVARVAAVFSDVGRQLEWLSAALDTDRNNGEVAADLAELALSIGDLEMALKALRAITLLKSPCRMPRAVAFLRQAQIAHRQGEAQKALVFARRARAEDAHLTEATDFLRQIGDA